MKADLFLMGEVEKPFSLGGDWAMKEVRAISPRLMSGFSKSDIPRYINDSGRGGRSCGSDTGESTLEGQRGKKHIRQHCSAINCNKGTKRTVPTKSSLPKLTTLLPLLITNITHPPSRYRLDDFPIKTSTTHTITRATRHIPIPIPVGNLDVRSNRHRFNLIILLYFGILSPVKLVIPILLE